VIRSGDMTDKQRTELLASMTDELAQLVLHHNYEQNMALASSVEVASSLMHVHESWIRRLERKGYLDREIEFLPTDKEFQARRQAGIALTTPELAVLLAYTKIVLAQDLLASDLPDDPFLRGELFSYFPTELRQEFREAMSHHPLRREIIVTRVVNNMVNFAGVTFFHRLSQETSASAEELARAHFVSREVYGADDLVRQICGLDNKIDASIQTDMRLAVRTLIERASRWLVNNRRPPLDSESTVEYFGTDIQKVMHALPEILTGVQAEEFESRRQTLESRGVPEDLARSIAVLPPAYAVLEVVEIAKRDGIDALEVSRVHSVLAERLGLSDLMGMIYDLPRDDRWQTMARASLRDDLHAVHALLTAQVLGSTDEGSAAEDRVSAWETSDSVVVNRAKQTLGEITSENEPDLARMSVGLRVVRTMLTN